MEKFAVRIEAIVEPDRLRPFRDSLACSLFGGNIVFGAAQETAHKFVLFAEGIFAIGPFRSHSNLVAACHELKLAAEGDSLIAAGNVGPDGSVISWQSEDFRLVTPPEMMEEIEVAVADLVWRHILPLPLPS